MIGISYDDPATLGRFATEFSVTFPLLSDGDSRVIRTFGLENTQIQAQHDYYGVETRAEHFGSAIPGIFALDDGGTVVSREFNRSYRIRPGASTVLESPLTRDSGAWPILAEHKDDPVHARVFVSDSSYSAYERFVVRCELIAVPGWHIYLPDIQRSSPKGAHLIVEGAQCEESRLVSSAGDQWVDEPGGERRPVAQHIVLEIPAWFEDEDRTGGMLRVDVEYQACSDTECTPPRRFSSMANLLSREHLKKRV